MTVSLSGFLYDDSGGPISGANVAIFPTSVAATISTATSSATANTTTSSAGLWDETALADNQYDVRITLAGGTSVRWLRHDSEAQYAQLSLISDTDATSNQVLTLGSDNATRADNDEVFVRFVMDNDAGEVTEFARMTAKATDVSNGSEDGQIEFDVMKSGTLTNAFTITSSAAGAQSLDLNQDTITLGTATDTDISLTFDANTADGVLTWMEDEDYFKFSDDILMNSTERINFYDTAIYIYSSADGQLDLVADTEIQIAATTIDINGAIALNGAVTGATAITSGTIDATTDFTIGSTVVTDGVITDSSGLSLAANVTVSGAVDIQGGYSNGGGAPFDGVVDVGNGGNWDTIQAGDDDLDAGSYTMLVKSGTYGAAFTVSTDNAYIYVEPGSSITGAVVLSGDNVTLEIGSGSTIVGLLTMSGANVKLICHNGVDLDGIVMSGAMGLVDGGGWDTISNGGVAVHAISMTAADCIVKDISVITTAGGGQGFDGIHGSSGAVRYVVTHVQVLDSDDSGMEFDNGAVDGLIEGCVTLGADALGLYMGGSRTRLLGNHYVDCGGDGIRVGSTGEDSIIVGNIVKDHGDDCIELSAGGDNCVVQGNRLDGAVRDDSTGSTIGNNDETAF